MHPLALCVPVTWIGAGSRLMPSRASRALTKAENSLRRSTDSSFPLKVAIARRHIVLKEGTDFARTSERGIPHHNHAVPLVLALTGSFQQSVSRPLTFWTFLFLCLSQ
eukprot:scaffold163820_cov35-Prasinocladus_malaysianus.AAC.1